MIKIFQFNFKLWAVKMKFLIFVSFVLTATVAEWTQEGKDCVISVFENKTLPSVEDEWWCYLRLKLEKDDFRAAFEHGLNKSSRNCDNSSVTDACKFFARKKDCLMETFDEFLIGDLYMKGRISYWHLRLNETESSNATSSEDYGINGTTSGVNSATEDYYSDVNKTNIIVSLHIGSKCVEPEAVEGIFQAFLREAKNMTAEETFCLRRFAFENDLIKPADYNVSKSNLTSYDCESTFEQFEDKIAQNEAEPIDSIDYFGVKDRAISDCEKRNQATNRGLLEVMKLKHKAIATFDLSPKQTEDLNLQVIDVIKEESLVFLNCVRDYCDDHCERY